MHHWNDEGEIDWKGIGDCANYIQEYLRKWGRVNVHTKEKYGRVDVSLSTGWHQLHSITHPGYVHSQYPRWLWLLDCMYLSHIVSKISIHGYQLWLVRRCYRNALAKWPHLREEILHGAPHELGPEFGIHTIRLGSNYYETRYDWHPDNFYVRFPTEPEPTDPQEPVIKWRKRDYPK